MGNPHILTWHQWDQHKFTLSNKKIIYKIAPQWTEQSVNIHKKQPNIIQPSSYFLKSVKTHPSPLDGVL